MYIIIEKKEIIIHINALTKTLKKLDTNKFFYLFMILFKINLLEFFQI